MAGEFEQQGGVYARIDGEVALGAGNKTIGKVSTKTPFMVLEAVILQDQSTTGVIDLGENRIPLWIMAEGLDGDGLQFSATLDQETMIPIYARGGEERLVLPFGSMRTVPAPEELLGHRYINLAVVQGQVSQNQSEERTLYIGVAEV